MSSFGGSVKLTGESEYRKALSEISSNLKVLNSEMKSVTSQYDKNDKSVENLSSQNEVLNKKIEEQEKKVNLLKDALAESQKETGENSEKTKKWQIELNNAQTDLNKLNRELDTNSKTMEEAVEGTKDEADAVEDFGKEAEKSGDKALSLGDIIKANLISEGILGGLSALADGIKGIGAKFGEFLALGEETKETTATMDRLYGSFEKAGLYADDANDSMFALQGVLGDMGRSAEASNLLAKMSIDTKDLEANTRILTGVFAEFGDSIPTEGLAEGMQATAEMGSVQGVLADALEWQGVNLDEYNEKLASMTSAEERAAYIQSTLTDLYGESADAYRENNKALIESNEAQLRYELNLADIGKMAMPVNTSIKNISTSLMNGFFPALKSVMPGIQSVTNEFSNLVKAIVNGNQEGANQAFYMISEGITDVIVGLEEAMPQVMELVGNLLRMVLDLIGEYLPWIIEEGALMLSSLLSGITSKLDSIFPAILSVIQTVIQTILQNLPMLLEMGISMLVSLIQGISSMLPDLIPLAIDAVILLCETLLDNIDLIIDAGIDLIFALADGLLVATPILIDKIPFLIDKLVVSISKNFPLLLEMGIELTLKLADGIIKAIPQLVSKIPQIVNSITSGLKSGLSKIGEIGSNIVSGIWSGISNGFTWIKNKIKGWVGDLLGFFKKLLGINSPSTVFEEQVGENMALGVGEGFTATMSDVTKEMASAIPTEFDADISTNLNGASAASHIPTFDMMVSAFKQALTEVKVVMDDREMGGFVTNTVERVVFA